MLSNICALSPLNEEKANTMRFQVQRQDENGNWQQMAVHDDFDFAETLLTDRYRRILDTKTGIIYRQASSETVARWHFRGEILLPVIQGLCAMWAIGIMRRMMEWPLEVDVLAVLAAVVGGGVGFYRFFAKKNA